MTGINWVALIVMILLFALVTVMGFMAARWRRPKDLDSLQAFALKTKTPLPMTGTVIEIHRLLCAAGLGPRDSAEMMRLLDGKLS